MLLWSSGSTAGNVNNTLQVQSQGKVSATALRLAKGNRLLIKGNPTAASIFLRTAPLQIWVGGIWQTVTSANSSTLVRISQSDGYTVIVPAR